LWLPRTSPVKDDLQDSSSWSSPPFLLLRYIHSKLLSDYRLKEIRTPSQSRVHVEVRGGLNSQDGVSHQEEDVPLSISQLNRLIETSVVRDEISVSNTVVTVISSQHRVTQQILNHCQSFRDLKLMFTVSCRAKQLRLRKSCR
jgi:hypothetical protein